MQLLKIELGILLVILGKTVLDGFLQLFLDVATNVANFDLGLLGNLVALLHQVATALFGGLGDTQTDDFAIVFGGDTHIAVHDGFLDVANLFLVPRLDGDGACIGCGHVGYLIEWNFLSVGLYSDTAEDGHVGTSCAYAVQFFLEEHCCHFHALFSSG